MDIPIGIEGDYLETKDDNLIFDVKGLLHPKDRKICFIRFYPDENGDRIRDGVKYKKIYNLEERYKLLKNKYPQYLFHSKQIDLELQGVQVKDIKKIYTPREYLIDLQEKPNLNRMERNSLELCELFVNEGNLPKGTIGITRSPMVNLNLDMSDIDLIIYGTQESLEFQENLANIIKQENFCREYTLEEYQTHFEWRVGGSDIPFDQFLKCERRKIHQGMYKGFEFFIRYIKSPQDWNGIYEDFQFKNLGRIKIKAEIIDSTDAIFTPCSYKIFVIDILDNSQISSEIKKEDIIEVNSYRGRYCEHAIKGETVKIEGKLEKVTFQGRKEYYRVLLQDQIHDKMY